MILHFVQKNDKRTGSFKTNRVTAERFFPLQNKLIFKNWYGQNVKNPYANIEVKAELAKKSNLKISKVIKWQLRKDAMQL